jgi:transmembrane sensor
LDPLIREALNWIITLKSGDATPIDSEQFVDWCNKSPAHERALHEAKTCWHALGRALLDDHRRSPRHRGKTEGKSLT